MKPPAEKTRFPCIFVLLILVTAILIFFLLQTYGAGWSSVLAPGRSGAGGPLEQITSSLRGLGQSLSDIYNNILP